MNNEHNNSTSATLPNGSVVQFSACQSSDVSACAVIETASFPEDEAASPDQLAYRQAHAGSYFRVAKHANAGTEEEELIGFICGTLCRTMTEESMRHHDPQGQLLAIHGVVVAAAHRRQGVASAMLRDYIATIQREHPTLQKMVLLSKAHLLSFYVNCGFKVLRPSPIVHGSEQWFDLELDLGLTYSVVDAFVVDYQAGTGNPAAVVVLTDEHVEDAWMQRVAAEFNLSETAFLSKTGPLSYRIRYFSPTTEVDLCGHATLAAAAALQQEGVVTFTANHDIELLAQYDPTKNSVTMEFPGQPVTLLDDELQIQTVHTMLYEALLIPPETILAVGVVPGLGDLFVHVTPSAMDDHVTAANVDALRTCKLHTVGVIVSCDRGAGVVASRFFAPKAGIPEDPVTGSAHTAIAPYFTRGRSGVIAARQESPRGGQLHCRVDDEGVVHLTGTAITTMEGRLRMTKEE